MNTREQRAEAYAKKLEKGYLGYQFDHNVSVKAYIAGAQEEAAIKDKVIIDLLETLKTCRTRFEFLNASTCEVDYVLAEYTELLEELAKGKV